MNVYFISGLAADRAVFKYIQLPSFCRPFYLDWLEPSKNESLPQYALRLSRSINTEEPFVLIGLSFGGMLAVEIAKILKPVCTILISSVPTAEQLPSYFKLAAVLRLHKIVPIGFIQNAAVLKRFFTTETAEDKKILKAMIRKSQPQFVRWAMHAVLTWRNTQIPQNLIHIHGTRDEVLPFRFVKATHAISGGGHLLVLNRAKEVNTILWNVLSHIEVKD